VALKSALVRYKLMDVSEENIIAILMVGK
jgi:hypothetical protein